MDASEKGEETKQPQIEVENNNVAETPAPNNEESKNEKSAEDPSPSVPAKRTNGQMQTRLQIGPSNQLKAGKAQTNIPQH